MLATHLTFIQQSYTILLEANMYDSSPLQVGERTATGVQNGTCPQDCPLPYTLCPATEAGLCSATGRCSFSSGLCSCYAGCVIMTSNCSDLQ